MKQASLLDFWSSKSSESSIVKSTSLNGSARDVVSKFFIRPIPEGDRYRLRLEEEYELIERNNFTKTFVQVKTILNCIGDISKESGKPIPHIIRGSAGSSLVCYLMGITHIDPILYGIELARFMNTCRHDIPDIDIDVPYNRREEIYARICKVWTDQVARVSNHIQWKPKSALRDSIKSILLEKEKTPDVQKALKTVQRKQFKLTQCLQSSSDQERALADSKKKVGSMRGHSKHCGGIVIFEEEGAVPKDAILKPIDANGVKLVQLKLDKDEVEEKGWIKIDLLSNRGLAQLADICPDRPLMSYPTRDNQTERIFAKGLTIGITFGESRGMRKIFMEMCPINVKDVAIALALIRPAAAAEGRKQTFLEKWKDASIEEDWKGLQKPIVFDDDAIQKIRIALQCSSAEADWWRKAFAKRNGNAKLAFRDALIKRGYSKIVQDTLIEDLEQLEYYSFCKSHAISYAQLVWALAYWKAHHAHAFWCATLNHCHSDYRKWVHYREAKLSGLNLSREAPPYEVRQRNGRPALCAIGRAEQQLLVEDSSAKQMIRDLKEHGYWLTDAFLPRCGLWKESQQRLDKKIYVRFKGLIASGRTVQRGSLQCTLLCIGVENGVYKDLVLADQLRGDLLRWSLVEGKGILRADGTTIDVKTIRGVSLKTII